MPLTLSVEQRLQTREEFEAFLLHQRVHIYVAPYEIQACDCRDINCRGWRLVAVRLSLAGRS